MAFNSQGNTTSPWASVLTPESPPRGLSAPTVLTLGAFSVRLSWQPPSDINGILLKYRVEWRPLASDPTQPVELRHVTLGPGVTTTSISGLTPYVEYQVSLINP